MSRGRGLGKVSATDGVLALCQDDLVSTPTHRSGPGRPRLTEPLRPGATARAQILDAAAELFTTRGYASTSTRAIADAVGIRQPSLYHHFATKNDLLEALLIDTVTSALPVAEALLAVPPADADLAAARLHALALFDGRQLCGTRWNVGVLYLLPELRTPRFLPFQATRERLRQGYLRLGADVATRSDGPAEAGDLAFRLVESLVSMRADGLVTASSPPAVAVACVRAAGWCGDPAALERASAALLDGIAS
jgi:AcrR family transcriptional regulator